MKRPITICSAQYGDIPLDKLLPIMSGIGYQGLELAMQSHVDVNRIANDKAYLEQFKELMAENHMIIGAISAHLAGQCVGDWDDARLNNFAPAHLAENREGIRQWAVEEMKTAAKAARLLGVDIFIILQSRPLV